MLNAFLVVGTILVIPALYLSTVWSYLCWRERKLMAKLVQDAERWLSTPEPNYRTGQRIVRRAERTYIWPLPETIRRVEDVIAERSE